jgi:outer membrane protein assembly factor BamB
MAADWNNSGGNAGRNGLTTEIGPVAPDLLWEGGRSSIIAWQPVTEGNHVFMVRQLRWPYEQPHDAYVVAMDLLTGDELWAEEIPYEDGDWTPWIAGVMNGRVYVSRAGNGASVSAVLYALDVADGSTIWTSEDMIDAGFYDGVVFAPDGDPVIASFRDIWRIDAETGQTVWNSPRSGSVSGNCGGAVFGDAVYVADAAVGGHVMVRYDLTSGARLYESPVMDGFLMQNTPMVDPAGRIYLCRVQNNPAVDHFYSFTDTGTEFIQNWRVEAAYCTSSEFGIGPDGSVYMMTRGPRLARLDPETGEVLNETDTLTGFSKPRIAVDAAGKVFFSNGAFATGQLTVYDAELNHIWDTPVTNINIGGPAIGQDGVLVVCGIGTDVRAYRSDVTAVAESFDLGNRSFALSNAPNPFRETTSLSFTLAESGPVDLRIFDPQGRLVRVLAAGDHKIAGQQRLSWDARDTYGNRVAAGVYLVRITGGQQAESRRVHVLR